MIVDNATLEWARSSHPNETVREVAAIMLAAGDNPVTRAERLAEFVDRERERNTACWECGAEWDL